MMRKRRIKVCILSMQRVDNMGSLLQAYGLKRILESMECDVEFLDIRPNQEDNLLLSGRQLDYSKEKEQKGLFGKIKKIDRYTVNRISIKLKSMLGKKHYERFRRDYLNIERSSPHYDVCVIGSDEVFNCMNTSGWGFTSQLFGNVPQAKRIITYAASCGATRYQDLPFPVVEKIRDSFNKISGFSVRDNNTFHFVSQLTSNHIYQHLDPVLIYDFDRELSQTSLPAVPERYCLVYSYYNRIHDPREIEEIQTFAQKHELTLVSLGAPQFWIKKHIECTPFQCLKLFQRSDFVITDTFHGTIFSSKYAKRFAVITRPSNYNKLSDLIERLNLQRHRVVEISEIDRAFSYENPQSVIKELVKKNRENTLNYLREKVKQV